MKKVFFLFAVGAAVAASGAWYWPFGNDEDDPKKPQRLHRLLEKANEHIELAEDEALNGDGDKAIENYKLALAELDRVERENPERAATSEFAPLRNKRATCAAAIDAIRFAQVNDNERAVAVSDTTELQKKWNRKHGLTNAEDTVTHAAPEKTKADDAPPAKEPPRAAPPVATNVVQAAAPVAAAPTNATPVATALADIRAQNYIAADLLLESLLAESPNDLNLLLLRAAAQAGMGSHYAARRTLERAMRAHPKSYLPYYNLANLSLTLGEGVDVARQYYEMGRTVGGPVSPPLEAKMETKK